MALRRPPPTTPKLYAQDGEGYGATVHAHYFVGSCDWLVTEYDPAEDVAFGWACLGDRQNAELGYVNLGELEAIRAPAQVRGPTGQGVLIHLAVEYDEHWTPGLTLSQAVELLDARSWG